MADTTTHLALPKPNRARVPSRNIDEEFELLALAWDMVDVFLHALALEVGNKAEDEHEHAMSKVIGLVDALNAKMPANRQFSLDDLTDVEGAASAPTNWVLVKSSGGLFVPSTALAALGVHPHLISEVTGLAAALADRPTRAEVAEGLNALDANVAADMADLWAEIQKRGIPVGMIADFPIEKIPLGWLIADGATFNPSLHPDLYTYLGTNVLPNYTDRVRRMRGPLAGAAGTTQEDDIKSHDHYGGVGTFSTHTGRFGKKTGLAPNIFSDTNSSSNSDEQTSAFNTSSTGGVETRVKSGIVVTCIKAFGSIVTDGMADLSALLTAISDQPTAEAGLDNTKVMTPLRVRQNVAAYNKYEFISRPISTGGSSQILLPNLQDFEEIFIVGWIRPQNTAYAVMQASANNGTSWISGASDYTSIVAGNTGGAASTGNSAAPHMYMTWSTVNNDDWYIERRLLNFNKARALRGRAHSGGLQSSGQYGAWTITDYGGAATAVVLNALKIFPLVGTMAYDLKIHGVRG